MVGQTLLHYHILKQLGKDGMGEVYLAEDTRLKRQMSIVTVMVLQYQR